MRRGQEVGPCPAVPSTAAGLVRNCPKNFPSNFSSLKLSHLAEKHNVHPCIHLPGGLQAVVYLCSGRCLWGNCGMMEGIFGSFSSCLSTSNVGVKFQIIFFCSLNEDLTLLQTTYGRPRTRGNCGRSDIISSESNFLKMSYPQDIRHKYENKEEEEE